MECFRLFSLETKCLYVLQLFEKNRVILEAERRLEEALTREAEVAQRSAWTEHKICLLKQDKHRRGETIGKAGTH